MNTNLELDNIKREINESYNANESNYKSSAPFVSDKLTNRIFETRKDLQLLKSKIISSDIDKFYKAKEYMKTCEDLYSKYDEMLLKMRKIYNYTMDNLCSNVFKTENNIEILGDKWTKSDSIYSSNTCAIRSPTLTNCKSKKIKLELPKNTYYFYFVYKNFGDVQNKIYVYQNGVLSKTINLYANPTYFLQAEIRLNSNEKTTIEIEFESCGVDQYCVLDSFSYTIYYTDKNNTEYKIKESLKNIILNDEDISTNYEEDTGRIKLFNSVILDKFQEINLENNEITINTSLLKKDFIVKKYLQASDFKEANCVRGLEGTFYTNDNGIVLKFSKLSEPIDYYDNPYIRFKLNLSKYINLDSNKKIKVECKLKCVNIKNIVCISFSVGDSESYANINDKCYGIDKEVINTIEFPNINYLNESSADSHIYIEAEGNINSYIELYDISIIEEVVPEGYSFNSKNSELNITKNFDKIEFNHLPYIKYTNSSFKKDVDILHFTPGSSSSGSNEMTVTDDGIISGDGEFTFSKKCIGISFDIECDKVQFYIDDKQYYLNDVDGPMYNQPDGELVHFELYSLKNTIHQFKFVKQNPERKIKNINFMEETEIDDSDIKNTKLFIDNKEFDIKRNNSIVVGNKNTSHNIKFIKEDMRLNEDCIYNIKFYKFISENLINEFNEFNKNNWYSSYTTFKGDKNPSVKINKEKISLNTLTNLDFTYDTSGDFLKCLKSSVLEYENIFDKISFKYLIGSKVEKILPVNLNENVEYDFHDSYDIVNNTTTNTYLNLYKNINGKTLSKISFTKNCNYIYFKYKFTKSESVSDSQQNAFIITIDGGVKSDSKPDAQEIIYNKNMDNFIEFKKALKTGEHTFELKLIKETPDIECNIYIYDLQISNSNEIKIYLDDNLIEDSLDFNENTFEYETNVNKTNKLKIEYINLTNDESVYLKLYNLNRAYKEYDLIPLSIISTDFESHKDNINVKIDKEERIIKFNESQVTTTNSCGLYGFELDEDNGSVKSQPSDSSHTFIFTHTCSGLKFNLYSNSIASSSEKVNSDFKVKLEIDNKEYVLGYVFGNSGSHYFIENNQIEIKGLEYTKHTFAFTFGNDNEYTDIEYYLDNVYALLKYDSTLKPINAFKCVNTLDEKILQFTKNCSNISFNFVQNDKSNIYTNKLKIYVDGEEKNSLLNNNYILNDKNTILIGDLDKKDHIFKIVYTPSSVDDKFYLFDIYYDKFIVKMLDITRNSKQLTFNFTEKNRKYKEFDSISFYIDGNLVSDIQEKYHKSFEQTKDINLKYLFIKTQEYNDNLFECTIDNLTFIKTKYSEIMTNVKYLNRYKCSIINNQTVIDIYFKCGDKLISSGYNYDSSDGNYYLTLNSDEQDISVTINKIKIDYFLKLKDIEREYDTKYKKLAIDGETEINNINYYLSKGFGSYFNDEILPKIKAKFEPIFNEINNQVINIIKEVISLKLINDNLNDIQPIIEKYKNIDNTLPTANIIDESSVQSIKLSDENPYEVFKIDPKNYNKIKAITKPNEIIDLIVANNDGDHIALTTKTKEFNYSKDTDTNEPKYPFIIKSNPNAIGKLKISNVKGVFKESDINNNGLINIVDNIYKESVNVKDVPDSNNVSILNDNSVHDLNTELKEKDSSISFEPKTMNEIGDDGLIIYE